MSHYSVAVFVRDPADLDERMAPFYEGVEPDSPYAVFREDTEGGYTDPATGKKGWISNPNAKWDWYEVGGRWNNSLRIKGNPDTSCNEAQVCEIDFSIDEDAYNKALRFWEVVVEGSPIYGYEREEDFRSFFNAKYYLEQYGTKENYAKSAASFSVWAFITPDGEWHENGAMGWFGFNDATQESRRSFAEELEKAIQEHPDCWLTMVDCHI